MLQNSNFIVFVKGFNARQRESGCLREEKKVNSAIDEDYQKIIMSLIERAIS